jgi:hypothetical protein
MENLWHFPSFVFARRPASEAGEVRIKDFSFFESLLILLAAWDEKNIKI